MGGGLAPREATGGGRQLTISASSAGDAVSGSGPPLDAPSSEVSHSHEAPPTPEMAAATAPTMIRRQTQVHPDTVAALGSSTARRSGHGHTRLAGPTVPPAVTSVRDRTIWLAGAALSSALGVSLVAIADAASRRGDPELGFLFWSGLLAIFVPTAYRVLSASSTPSERLLLVTMLGSTLYLVKVAAAPSGFTFIDEFIHLRTLQDILRTHQLFTFNPLLPASSVYPGLETATAEIVDMTRLSPFVAGLLVVGLARLLICSSFFFVIQRVTGSSRAAAVAALIYAGNPMFLFWSAYFSYENLGLPLAAFVVWWLARTRRARDAGTVVVAVLGVSAVTVTHHVAGFALAAILVGWWATERIIRGPEPSLRRLGGIAAFSVVATLAWMATIARPAIAYLWSENVYPGLSQTVALVQGQLAARTLFSSASRAAPLWERLAGFGGVAVLLLALPFGVYLAWKRHRVRPALLVAAGVAALYPLSLIPRFAPAGVAISGRSSEYLYAGLGCIVGMLAEAVITYTPRPRAGWPWSKIRMLTGRGRARAAVTALMTLVFIGGVTVGTPFTEILPEAANPVGYPSSVQPDVFVAAVWARTNLGSARTFAANAQDAPVLGSYGDQNPISESAAIPIFFASTMDSAVVRAIRQAKVDYILVDLRMADGVPINPSYYFTPYEPHGSYHAHPLPSSYLTKFGTTSCDSLIYSAGPLQIYDLTPIANGSCTPGKTGT